MRNKRIYIAGHVVEGLDCDSVVALHVNTRQLNADGKFGDGKIFLTQRHLLEIQELLNPDYYEQMIDIGRRKAEEKKSIANKHCHIFFTFKK